MQIWTNQLGIAEATLTAARIPRVELLQFIDEFPHVTERLPGDPSSDETIAAVIRSFEVLLPRPFPAAGVPLGPKLS